jgi:hypothetical protein
VRKIQMTDHQAAVYRFSRCHLYFSFTHSQLSKTGAQDFSCPNVTFQPNRRRRSKTHGFRTRMKTKSGRGRHFPALVPRGAKEFPLNLGSGVRIGIRLLTSGFSKTPSA